MSNLRRWDLSHTAPYALSLAADARLCQTSYTDDQSWEVHLGTASDETALALHTRYGGRVGLASLVPMWQHAGRTIYQNMTYHHAPTIQQFAPNYMALSGDLLPDVRADYVHLVLSSQALGGLYTITNHAATPLSLRFEFFAQVGREGQADPLATVALTDGNYGLSLSALPDFGPVLLVEDSTPTPLATYSSDPRLGVDLQLEPGEARTIRWVHVGLSSVRRSIAEAQAWLRGSWDTYLEAINDAAQAIPQIETANLDWDAVLASSVQRAMQAVLRPAGNFPGHTFVASRLPEYGYSRRGDGSDHPRMWDGQDALLTYQLMPFWATIDPVIARGILGNYFAGQADDGFVDLKPGPAGQRQDLLVTPLLACTAWQLYERTGDEAFLQDAYPRLQKSFQRWLQQDTDGDGAPEWQDDRQTGYMAFPTFAPGQEWAQGADIQFAETPDLIGYLLAEANSLAQMAAVLGDDDALERLQSQAKALGDQLEAMWEGDHYAYRDRDTDTTTRGMVLLEKGSGAVQHTIERSLAVPNRLLVRVIGGVNHIPNMTLHITGVNQTGETVTEKATANAFLWQNRQGVYTSRTVFTRVDTLHCEGLSRVYYLYARTVDTTGLDLNAILPFWSGALADERVARLVTLLLDEAHFLRANGFTMVSAQDERFDPSNAEGAGGLWLQWQTLLGEALLTAGQEAATADLMRRILRMLDSVLTLDHEFAQFYHADKPIALAEKGHLGGIVPLSLFMRLIGIEIRNPGQVQIDPIFAWGEPIVVRQHGVTIERDTEVVRVRFASGKVVEQQQATLREPLLINDEAASILPAYNQIALTQPIVERVRIPLDIEDAARPPKVIIDVELED